MQKSRGFEGELIIEVPKVALAQCEKTPLIRTSFITRMGFYPKALYHYYQRPTGISQVILIYCTDGKGWLQIKKEKITIQAGEVFVIPKDVPHSYGADVHNPWSIYWFHFSGSHCTDVFNGIMDKKNGYKPMQVGFSESRNTIFKQIATTFLKGYSASNLLFANLSLPYYLSSFITPEHFQKDNIVTPLSTTDLAIHFMQQNLSNTLTLDSIAQSACLSVSFFSRKFKQDTG